MRVYYVPTVQKFGLVRECYAWRSSKEDAVRIATQASLLIKGSEPVVIEMPATEKARFTAVYTGDDYYV